MQLFGNLILAAALACLVTITGCGTGSPPDPVGSEEEMNKALKEEEQNRDQQEGNQPPDNENGDDDDE